MNIGEFSKLTGVSIRTIRYYDEIGLLKPEFVDEQSGYRYYGENSLIIMQEVLFFKELNFPLKTIRDIMLSPNYKKREALKEQKHLLTLKKERLEEIILSIEKIEKGERIMNFDMFSDNKINAYKDEVKERWGNTDAYKENQAKTANYTDEKWADVAMGLNSIMSEFANSMKTGAKYNDNSVHDLVEKLKNFITETQYTCTNEILLCLGDMYVSDDRFKKNIDKNGLGTAEYINNAIKAYCNMQN